MFSNLETITTKKHRFSLWILFILLIISTFIEMIGIGSIPIFAMIILNPEKLFEFLPNIELLNIFINLDKKQLVVISGIILVVIFFLKNLFLGLINYFQGKTIQLIRTDLFNNLFELYINSKYEFHIIKNPAELVRNISNDVPKCVQYIMGVINLVKETLVMSFIFITLLLVEPKISFILFCLLGFFSISFFLFSRKGSTKRGKIAQVVWGKALKITNHALGSIKLIKILK